MSAIPNLTHRAMRKAIAILALASLSMGAPVAAEPNCHGQKPALGVSRSIAIDATNGPIYGDITKAAKEPSFLAAKEVVLTFDDGPMPWITSSILESLDRHCAKATFFSVGRMALAYPETTREIVRRGHTLGAHTWSHPLNITLLRPDRSITEIERGFAAISLAAGRPIAPFFRFPGLSDSALLLAHLQSRGIASFTVDVVSNDSYIGDWQRLSRLTLQRIESRQGGIVLFHDIKSSTAKALPTILAELAARGYRVVHIKPTRPVAPVTTYDAELGAILSKAEIAAGSRKALMPFFGSASTVRPEPVDEQPAARLTADAKPRGLAALPPTSATKAQKSAVRQAPVGQDVSSWSSGPTEATEYEIVQRKRARRSLRPSDSP